MKHILQKLFAVFRDSRREQTNDHTRQIPDPLEQFILMRRERRVSSASLVRPALPLSTNIFAH